MKNRKTTIKSRPIFKCSLCDKLLIYRIFITSYIADDISIIKHKIKKETFLAILDAMEVLVFSLYPFSFFLTNFLFIYFYTIKLRFMLNHEMMLYPNFRNDA